MMRIVKVQGEKRMNKEKDESQSRDGPIGALSHCTVAPDPEHHRAHHEGYWEDDACDDARATTFGKKEKKMQKEKEICEKIKSIYPEIGECGIDVQVEWSEDKKTWIVDLKKDHNELITHLEEKDAQACLEGKKCVNLGMQVAQLKANIESSVL
jgi:hypothetical protein